MINVDVSDRYRVVRKLGDGGMGKVYLVEHRQLGRREALKILRKGLDRSPQFIARFRREARALNRLKHPNIVCVYDFGTLADGSFYLSAEYADGESLRHVIDSTDVVPISRAVDLMIQLARAISHAHARGVIHRDLKPENIIIEKDHRDRDVLKVLDFGVAKIVAPDYEDSAELTKRGSTFGTPHYMSPEQVKGKGEDPRIDIYAVGCIMFELVVGTPPFSGLSPLDVMHAQVYDEPPRFGKLRLLDPIPDDYEKIVLKCLAKNPADRFQAGQELVDALEKMTGFAPNHEGAAAPRRKSQTTILHNPIPFHTSSDEFDDATTIVDHEGQFPTMRGRRAGSVTRELGGPPSTLDEMIIALANYLVAHGCDDPNLAVQLCLVQEMKSELEQWLDEAEEIEQRRSQVAQRAKHSEATLRFSLGELRFEYERAKERDGATVERLQRHIDALEQRLARSSNMLEGEFRAIDERLAFLEATCVEREQQLDQSLAELRDMLLEVAQAYVDDQWVWSMLVQLRKTTSLA